jgi:outer membrane receptor protein involved in Fe transport
MVPLRVNNNGVFSQFCMYLKINLFTSLIILLFASAASAQTGTIRGQVIDDGNGEPLIGTTVSIRGTTMGSATDMDGKFTIANVAPGTHSLQVSFISYLTTVVADVVVAANEVTLVNNIRLKEASTQLQEVVVTSTVLKNSETALLTAQRKSSQVMDGISSEMFSKNNDNDAASAIRRVTGVSVEGGKYMIVRGLGDRYSKAALNKAELPSLDPNKNAVQMDLFPSNLLDNMVVYKTFSPDLPGSFSGGFVEISTKEFPDRFTVKASGSLGYNTNATFNDEFLTGVKGKNYFLGFDDGTYDLPKEAQYGIPAPAFNAAQDVQLDIITKSFNNSFDPQKEKLSPFLNQNLSFSIGNQYNVLGKQLGFVAGLTYQHNYEYYENGIVGRYFLPGVAQGQDLIAVRDFHTDNKGTESVLWGAMANVSLRLNPNHKIGLNLLRSQSSDLSSRYLQGFFPADANADTDELQVRSIRYVERSLVSAQLKGDHSIGGKLKLDWSAAYILLDQVEPDQRFFNNIIAKDPVTEESDYFTFQNATSDPSRYYRYLDETDYDGKLNFELPFNNGQQRSKIKFGASYQRKDRNFNERIITYKQQNADVYEGVVDDYFADDNLGVITSSPYRLGIYTVETQNLGGSYNGIENIPAAYAMVDMKMTKNLRVSAGARYEGTDIQLNNTSPFLPDSLKTSRLEKNDVLPAVNVTYELRDNMNLRLAYGKTIARPTFRELSQFTSFDFLGDARETGNVNLRRTSIQSFDVRWEVFPKAGEYISASVFYKNFIDPIERVTSPYNNEPKDGLSFFYNNVPQAELIGLEFEFRKSLEFIAVGLRDFKIGTNLTLMKSEVDINKAELEQIRVNNPEAEATRPLFGQSPYIINATLGYDNLDKKWNVNLVYNIIGPRLFLVSTNGTPNIYEQPRNSLDMTISKGITNRLNVRLSMQNLLDAPFKYTQEFASKEYIYQSYQLGSTFSFGITFLVE